LTKLFPPTDVTVGRCWRSYVNNECSGNIGNRLLTKEECCNTLGQAWGNVNCRPCSDFTFPCDHGYKLNIQTNECENINECEIGVCEEGAECVDLDGSFRCECSPGLTLRSDGTSCTDVRVGICYQDVSEDGYCSGTSADTILMTKHQCCCTVGQGWGSPCETCPEKNTQAWRKLCIPDGLRLFFRICFRTINPIPILFQVDSYSQLFLDICIQNAHPYSHSRSVTFCIILMVTIRLIVSKLWHNFFPVTYAFFFPNLCIGGECKNTDTSFTCLCNQGYTLDESGNNCTDIDECVISPGLCGNGVCINTGGDFTCDCEEGYEDSVTLKVCTDIDECSLPGHCTGGTCFNTEGSYECACPPGRSLGPDGTNCCALRPDLCEPNGRCENMLGYYMCICDVGYIPTPDARDCVDIDECLDNNGGCHMGCTNTIGSYECSCDDGFVLAFDGHTCADRDECMEQMNRCDGGTCENTDGAFRCVCFDGFMATADLQFCEDIDECAMNANVCMHGKCHNTRGSYTCNCEQGYCVPQGQMICVDKDDCIEDDSLCGPHGQCLNVDGSFECDCPMGFVTTDDRKACKVLEKYDTRTGNCFNSAEGDELAPICTGQIGTDVTRGTCCCIDNAGAWGNPCELCPSVNSSEYHTLCPGGPGFRTNPITVLLEDINECVEVPGVCRGGKCINGFGTYICECSMGYQLNSATKTCEDIDECNLGSTCTNGACTNTRGGFICDCNQGFVPINNDKACEGKNLVNECDEEGQCNNGICDNTPGGFACDCDEGYTVTPDGRVCIGAFPFYISYVNECEAGDKCINGACVNTPGGFECDCPKNSIVSANKKTCIDQREAHCYEQESQGVCSLPGNHAVKISTCCCQCTGGGWGSAEDDCEACPSNGTLEFKNICPNGCGFTPDGIGECSSLFYLNECEKNNPCINGRCVNQPGSFRCECTNGFTLDDTNRRCVDVDECKPGLDLNQCVFRCVNTDGSFHCDCPNGFELRE
uniref:Fibrillin 2b n=1 Tax=Ciona savignyi TaxID=51511 RepID=H2ZJD7_CIOSA